MSATTTRKNVAKTAPKPGPAKNAAKPAAPKPPAVTTPAPAPVDTGIVPSVALSEKMQKGKAHTFRLKTEEIAVALGYKISTEPPFDRVVLFERGNVKLRVTYSEQDYVRKVEGATLILPGEAKKWIRLNTALNELAKG